MPQDQVIKSGQLTLPRILFLVAVGAVIVGAVALGGVFLTIGYWILTMSLVVPLVMILRDDRVTLNAQEETASYQAAEETAAVAAPAEAPRARRRAARPARRRR